MPKFRNSRPGSVSISRSIGADCAVTFPAVGLESSDDFFFTALVRGGLESNSQRLSRYTLVA
jgi:hypothetical protein